MLSVSGAMDAGAAGSYFSKEDYYLQGDAASEWLGKGAENLGLTGPVDKQSFSAVCHGLNPNSGEELVAGKITKSRDGEKIETHRAGNDLTFSAPKSVSIAYAAGVEGVMNQKTALEHLLTSMMNVRQQSVSTGIRSSHD